MRNHSLPTPLSQIEGRQASHPERDREDKGQGWEGHHHPDNNQTINQGQKIGTWRHQELEEAKLNELASFPLVDYPHLTL